MSTRFSSSPHPALAAARLTREIEHLPRRRREREFRLIADGLWLPVDYPGTTETLSVAYSRLYPDAVLTGWSAAVLHGIEAPQTAVPELNVGKIGRRRRGLRIRRFALPPEDIEVTRGVRMTSRRRTAFDLARFSDHLDGVLAVESFYRRGYSQRELIADVDDRRGTWGIAKVRRVLIDAHPDSESPRETLTRLMLRDAGFTSFIPQYEIPSLRFRLDLADPARRIAVEYDGAHHDDPIQQSKDRARRNSLQSAGWIVISVDRRIFHGQREILLRQVAAAYESRSSGLPTPHSHNNHRRHSYPPVARPTWSTAGA